MNNSFLNPSTFNDPFLTYSNLSIPKDFYTALEYSLFLALKTPTYLQAVDRIVAHFLTEIDCIGREGDTETKKELVEYLDNGLGLFEVLHQLGRDIFIFGNSFLRIHYPFTRKLIDRRNNQFRTYDVGRYADEDIKFNLSNMTYNIPDPLDPTKRVDLEFVDRKLKDKTKIRLRVLEPTRMLINMNWASGKEEYVYRFPEHFVNAVKKGEPIYQINDTPIDMLKAIRDDGDFAFNDNTIMHSRSPAITGVCYSGWGIPNPILNYSNFHNFHVIRCINEAIGLDYITPFRLLSPAPQGGSGGGSMSSFSGTHLGEWADAMQALVAAKRRNPTALHTVPFPVNYQELGANGKALAPVELSKYYEDELLNGIGLPSELYRMTMQYQQVPSAVKLFERSIVWVPRAFNNITKWVSKNCQLYMSQDVIETRLKLPSIANDLGTRDVPLNLAAGGEISRSTAYAPFNIQDPVGEQIKRMEEDMAIEKERKRISDNYERQMTFGSADQILEAAMQPQGGPPPQGGGVGPSGPSPSGAPGVTPLDLEQQGEELAMQLLSIESDGQRRKELMSIKATNEVLYNIVKGKMEEARREGASQGRAQVGKQPQ